MARNINTFIRVVNRSLYLPFNKGAYIIDSMTKSYAQRLAEAMAHAGLNQTELAARAEISQPSIHYLLKPANKATGSEFTPRFARICGVSPDWLADEIGEMIPAYFQTTDPKIIAACRLMEPLPEYAKDMAVKELAQVTELIANVRANHSHG